MRRKSLEATLGLMALSLVGCPDAHDNDTTPSIDDDTTPYTNDDDDSTTVDDDSVDDDSTYENHAPYALISAPENGATVTQNQPVIFDGCASYDKDDDPISYHWNFGDDETYDGAECSTQHTYTAAPGSKQVSLRVEDPQGASHEVSLELILEEEQPTNQPPVAIAGGPYNAVVNQFLYLYFDSSGTGSYDPDGVISLYTINWGDGSSNYNSNGHFIHRYDEIGAKTITLTVEDNIGATDTDITTIEIN